MNHILYISTEPQYGEELKLMRTLSPEIVKRKNRDALIQSAVMLHEVTRFSLPSMRIFSIGNYEDVVYHSLKKQGRLITGIDPVTDISLRDYINLYPLVQYPLVFSTSVLEHVEDDEAFLVDMLLLIEPGGVGLLTMDFQDTWTPSAPLPGTCVRFYTEEKMKFLVKILTQHGCSLTEPPNWGGSVPDFEYEGLLYNFAGLSFRKKI